MIVGMIPLLGLTRTLETPIMIIQYVVKEGID